MNNRIQFTVRDLLIWTTVLAAAIVSLKLLIDWGVFQSLSQDVKYFITEAAWIIFPYGMWGLLIAPLGMLVMLVAMTFKSSRIYSGGLFPFVFVCSIVWSYVEPHGDYFLLMLSAMVACSVICFVEAFYRKRNAGPETNSNAKYLFILPITSVIVLVATTLLLGSAILISQF